MWQLFVNGFILVFFNSSVAALNLWVMCLSLASWFVLQIRCYLIAICDSLVCQLVCQVADQLIVTCWQLVCQLVVDLLVNGLVNYLFAIGVQTFSDAFTTQLISVCKLCVNYFERSLSIIRSVNGDMVAIRVSPV